MKFSIRIYDNPTFDFSTYSKRAFIGYLELHTNGCSWWIQLKKLGWLDSSFTKLICYQLDSPIAAALQSAAGLRVCQVQSIKALNLGELR